MKRERILPNIEQTVDSPYADMMADAADALAAESEELSSSGKLTTVEYAGALAMATMLRKVAAGQLSPEQSTQFLKSLAEKKTPSPVIKTEQYTEVDFRVVLAAAVESNPDKMEHTFALARERQADIKRRLKLTKDMALPPLPPVLQSQEITPSQEIPSSADASLPEQDTANNQLSDHANIEAYATQGEPFNHSEPIEIRHIRKGGDGSEFQTNWDEEHGTPFSVKYGKGGREKDA